METSKPLVEPPSKKKKITGGFDLRSRPNVIDPNLQRKTETIVVKPTNIAGANVANFWTFQFRARKNQWIRLRPDALTVQIWGRTNNPNKLDEGTPKQKAEFWALNAQTGQPQMFVDPTVQATGFVKSVDVFINNVQVPTNGSLNNHLLHYVRCSRIYENIVEEKKFIGLQQEISFTQPLTPTMKLATKLFHYNGWNSRRGVRVPIFLDGIFPFDCRNKTIQTIDKDTEEFNSYFFPPETSFEIRIHLHKDKIEALFHDGMTDFHHSYYTAAAAHPIPNNLVLTFQDISLEYEATELNPSEHVQSIGKFHSGQVATYSYDIPRIQVNGLPNQQSFTNNTFQIQPMARLIYILFLPSWATFPLDTKRKPISAFSQFPQGATKIKISYGSDPHIITESFEDFGIRGTQHQITKKIYFDYLKDRKIFPGTFDQLFPQSETDISTLQTFIYDLHHQMSPKIEILNIQCTFGQGENSPSDTQIMCISVHQTGKAVCAYNSPSSDYIWTFNQAS